MLINIHDIVKDDLTSIKDIWIVLKKETAGPIPAVSYVSIPRDALEYELSDDIVWEHKEIQLKVWFVIDGNNSIKFFNITQPPILSDVPDQIKNLLRGKSNTETIDKSILKDVCEKAKQTQLIEDLIIGDKNLIYYSVYNDAQYLEMLNLSILSLLRHNNIDKFDILIITDKPTKKKISKFYFNSKIAPLYHITATPVDGVAASINKIKIFNFDKINDYQNILYLDCDTAFKGNIDEIFDNIASNTLYTANDFKTPTTQLFKTLTYGFERVDDEFLRRTHREKQYPFNAGQFLFKNSIRMQQHFKNLNYFIANWEGRYFFEQGFMNYYFCGAEITESNHLNKFVGFCSTEKPLPEYPKPITHFSGHPLKGYSKLNHINRFLSDIAVSKIHLPTIVDYIKYPIQKICNKILPKRIEVVDDTKKNLDLVKYNHRSSYPNNILSKHIICKKSKRMVQDAIKLNSISSGLKNLIYYTISGKEEWIELLRLSLSSLIKQPIGNFEVLIITSESFRDKIERLKEVKQLSVHYMIVDEPLDGVESSLNKLRIYQWNKIRDYNKVLFVDCDTLFVKSANNLFDLSISGDKLYTAWSSDYVLANKFKCFLQPFHGLSMYTDEDFDNMLKAEQYPFNAGQFLFVASEQMLKHFENIDWMAREWPGDFFFEQAFMCHYFCSNLLTDSSKIDNLVKLLSIVKTNPQEYAENINDSVIYHFIGNSLNGNSKIDYITTFLSHANIS